MLFQMDCRVKPGNDDGYVSFRDAPQGADPESRDEQIEIPGSRFARPGMTLVTYTNPALSVTRRR